MQKSVEEYRLVMTRKEKNLIMEWMHTKTYAVANTYKKLIISGYSEWAEACGTCMPQLLLIAATVAITNSQMDWSDVIECTTNNVYS